MMVCRMKYELIQGQGHSFWNSENCTFLHLSPPPFTTFGSWQRTTDC